MIHEPVSCYMRTVPFKQMKAWSEHCMPALPKLIFYKNEIISSLNDQKDYYKIKAEF